MLSYVYNLCKDLIVGPEERDCFSEQSDDIVRVIFSKLSARDVNSVCISNRQFRKFLKDEHVVDLPLARNFFNSMCALPSAGYIEMQNFSRFTHLLGKIVHDSTIDLMHKDSFPKPSEGDFFVHRNLSDVTSEKSSLKHNYFGRYYKTTAVSFAYVNVNLPKRTKLALIAGLDELNAFYSRRNVC
jgi:hypothetical protein